MNKDKLDLYESLIRASLAFILLVALTVAGLGIVAISQMFMRETIPAPQLLLTEANDRRT